MPDREAPYGVLWLRELQEGSKLPGPLFLPLTLAYLISAHLSLRLMVEDETCAAVDSAFDEILNGNALGSKGIQYRKFSQGAELEQLISQAELVVTTDGEIEKMASEKGIPTAFLLKVEDKGAKIKLRCLEKVADPALRMQLAGCAQLVNIQSGGFLTEGHFSLTW